MRVCDMKSNKEISSELLGVYASLIFAIGSLITLAAAIIDYRQSIRTRPSEISEGAGVDIPFLIR